MKKTYNVEAARTQLKNYLLYIAPETNQSELEELVQEFTPQYFTKKEEDDYYSKPRIERMKMKM